MDKKQKLDYQREIEKYLESKKVYELFEDLMKSLVISKPEDPIDFIIQKLSEPERTIFLSISILSIPKRRRSLSLGLQVLMLESWHYSWPTI